MSRARKLSPWPETLFLALAALIAVDNSEAQPVRGHAAQSVHARPAPQQRANAGGARNLSGRTAANGNRNVNGNGTINHNGNFNHNTNINNNTNINRNVDVNVDVDDHWDGGWRDHPVAAGVAFGTAAAVTAAAINSVVYSLPPACVVSPYSGLTYYHCGSAWYEPRYEGTTVTYVVVNAPY
ncbi:MAG: hypothetical protein ABUS48_01590 [Pseudomonadota bacterium]